MRLVGQVVEAPRIFGKSKEHVEVVVYDPDSRTAFGVAAFGRDGEPSEHFDDLAGLAVGDTADLAVGVEVYNGRVQVRAR